MSDDFEIASAAGASEVPVGRFLFAAPAQNEAAT
jgi:hypothetical protein